MNLKNNKGAIAIFVLVGLLFMAAFLIIAFSSITNKSKAIKEQEDIIKGIYYKEDDSESYDDAYAYYRKTNNSTITKSSELNEDTSVLELNNTYDEDLLNYKIYGNENSLPSEYQKVEYIESTGEQFIDTRYIPNDTTGLYVDMSTDGNGDKVAVGCSNGTDKLYINPYQSSKVYLSWNTVTQRAVDPTQRRIYKLNYLNGRKRYYGEEQGTDITQELADIPYSIYVFAANKVGSAYLNCSCKIYNLKISDGKSIIRNFIPCYCKTEVTDINGKNCTNGTIGLYDVINQKFYSNSGKGEFLKGEDIKTDAGVGDLVSDTTNENFGKHKIELKISNKSGENYSKYIYLDTPLFEEEYIEYKTSRIYRQNGTYEKVELPNIELNEDYTKIEVITENKTPKIEVEYKKFEVSKLYQTVEYIESTGTQYINTGVNPTNSTGIYIDMLSEGIGDTVALGSSDGTNKIYVNPYQTTNIYLSWGNTSGTNLDATIRRIYKMNYLNSRKRYYGDEIITNITTTLPDINYSIYAFAANRVGSAYLNCSCKIYSLKISQGTDIVRDFIPCYRKSDKVIGLYDTISKQFYTNQGTGEFIAGPEVD